MTISILFFALLMPESNAVIPSPGWTNTLTSYSHRFRLLVGCIDRLRSFGHERFRPFVGLAGNRLSCGSWKRAVGSPRLCLAAQSTRLSEVVCGLGVVLDLHKLWLE